MTSAPGTAGAEPSAGMPVAAQGSATGRIVAAASPRRRFGTQPAQQAPVLFRVRGARRRNPPYRAVSPGCVRNHPRRGGARYSRSDPACRPGSAWLVTAIALNVAGARTGDSNGRPPVRHADRGFFVMGLSKKVEVPAARQHSARDRVRKRCPARFPCGEIEPVRSASDQPASKRFAARFLRTWRGSQTRPFMAT